ncbi:hypothetical protein [Crenothrix sp.]|uniref:hypothetical protein n=1 Tax=Crenothrix sp. TaxID=3100433 RepID=UPI00374CFF5A
MINKYVTEKNTVRTIYFSAMVLGMLIGSYIGNNLLPPKTITYMYDNDFKSLITNNEDYKK